MPGAAARARANIALVKYWGKRDVGLNLPAMSSLSMTLSTLGTTTRVTFDPRLARDELVLDGRPAEEPARARVSCFLDLVRQVSGVRWRASVVSDNSVPTGSGLASSASGFAALALAATRAAGLEAGLPVLASLARRGSGSAPRSLLGGFVALPAGTAPDGSDCVPYQVAPPEHWDLRLVVVLTASGPKVVGSTEGMERTRRTSPYYGAWVKENAQAMQAAVRAIASRNLEMLGRVVEASAFRLHAVAMAADPAVVYWNEATVGVVRRVRSLRDSGLPCWLTMDAGPHVKVLCEAGDADQVARHIGMVPGVLGVILERPGPGAEVLP